MFSIISGIDGVSGRRRRELPVTIYPALAGEPQNALPLSLLPRDFIKKMIPIPRESRDFTAPAVNHRSGVALAMRHRLQWFIHVRAQCRQWSKEGR